MVAREAILRCQNAKKTLVSAPYPDGGSGCGPWCLSPPSGNAAPSSGCPLAPPLEVLPKSGFWGINRGLTLETDLIGLYIMHEQRYIFPNRLHSGL